ncbi:MAG: hypothetical protein IKQ03_01275 [Prevotella sp.]|nr:hypothetical protein [Prevotella sp.]
MKEFIESIESVRQWCNDKPLITGEEWLKKFSDIAMLVDKHLPKWHCWVLTAFDPMKGKPRYYEITIAKWYPRTRDFSLWERSTCRDERLISASDKACQRRELRRKLKKIIKLLENGHC